MAIDERKEPEPKATLPSMPESKKTVSLPTLTDRALLEDLARVVRTIADNVGETRNDLYKLNVKVTSTDERLARVEGRLVVLETAPVSITPSVPPPPQLTSVKVRALIDSTTSQMDLEHDAQLAQERAAREDLAAKVDVLTETQQTQLAILSRLDKITSNPLVKTILTILGTAFATWAASKGLK